MLYFYLKTPYNEALRIITCKLNPVREYATDMWNLPMYKRGCNTKVVNFVIIAVLVCSLEYNILI